MNLPSPVGNGWILVDGTLQQELLLHSPVPESIVELVRCKCKKGCVNNSCSCRRSRLQCTDACVCNENDTCQNNNNGESSSDEEYDV